MSRYVDISPYEKCRIVSNPEDNGFPVSELPTVDAIEQLVRERDEWKTLGSLANKRAEDYREMRRQRDKAIKECDAAVADFRLVANNCFEDYVFCACCCCKKNDTCNGQPATGCEFEWRGVREVEHEAD